MTQQQSVVLNESCKLKADTQTKRGKIIWSEATANLLDNHNGQRTWDTRHLPKLAGADGTQHEGQISAWVYYPKEQATSGSVCDNTLDVGIVAKMKETKTSTVWLFYDHKEEGESIRYYGFTEPNQLISDWAD